MVTRTGWLVCYPISRWTYWPCVGSSLIQKDTVNSAYYITLSFCTHTIITIPLARPKTTPSGVWIVVCTQTTNCTIITSVEGGGGLCVRRAFSNNLSIQCMLWLFVPRVYTIFGLWRMSQFTYLYFWLLLLNLGTRLVFLRHSPFVNADRNGFLCICLWCLLSSSYRPLLVANRTRLIECLNISKWMLQL